MLIHRKSFTDLEPGSYKMRLRVQSMGRTWDSQTYILFVPRPDIKNDQFSTDPLLWRLQQCFKGKEKKGESRRRTGRDHGGPPPLVSKELKKRWFYFINKVYETDPLVCPKCFGEMKSLASLTSGTSLERSLSTWVCGKKLMPRRIEDPRRNRLPLTPPTAS